jgi:hypothetical protein
VATDRATILGLIAGIVRTDSPSFVGETLEATLDEAVAKFSVDRPYEDVVDLTGEDAKLLTAPPNWEDEWSVIRSIVYPYEDEDSDVLQADAYGIERIPVAGTPTPKIRFRSVEPSSAETVRCWFTRPHVCTAASCTLSLQQGTAVAYLAAHLVEKKKASFYNGLSERGIGTDLVDYGRATEARSLARMHLETYSQLAGVSDTGVAPAAVAGDIDVFPKYPGRSPKRHHRWDQR